MFEGKAASACPKNLDIDTSLSLSQPGAGVREKNDPYNKSAVSASPALTSFAISKWPNLENNMNLQPKTNYEPKLIFMGCIYCSVYFIVPVVADPRCPVCRKKSFLLDAFLNFPRKRARMN